MRSSPAVMLTVLLSVAVPAAAAGPNAAPPTTAPLLRPHPGRQAPNGANGIFAPKPGPRGFHGLTWGMSLAEAQKRVHLVPVTKPAAFKDTFMRPDDALTLGQAHLRTVAYYFPHGRLAGVGITFSGDANLFLVKDHLIGLYGPGRQIGGRYGWTWKDRSIELRRHDGTEELRYAYEPDAPALSAAAPLPMSTPKTPAP